MPEYAWQALDAKGQEIKGHSIAETRKDLLAQLHAKGLVPLVIDGSATASTSTSAAHQTAGGWGQRASRRRDTPIRASDVRHFSAEFAIMTKSGLPLEAALRLLTSMSPNVRMGALVQALSASVKNGAPLSKALAAYPQQFDDFYINMIRSGEASGQLAATLEEVAAHLERQSKLRESITSAMLYPLILLVVSLASLVAMLGFVVPQFQNLFDDLGSALPLPTQVVVAAGHLVTGYWHLLAAGLAALVFGLRLWLKTPGGQRQQHEWLLRLPLLGSIAYQYQLSLFFRTMGTLLHNGVPLLQTVSIASETVGNSRIRSALLPLPGQLKSGKRLSQSLGELQMFDPLALNLVKVGEETGRLAPMLLELCGHYNRNVETGIKRSITLLEPVMILILGGMVAAIIVSILLGILAVNDLAI